MGVLVMIFAVCVEVVEHSSVGDVAGDDLLYMQVLLYIASWAVVLSAA
jgi:hypothetical protein